MRPGVFLALFSGLSILWSGCLTSEQDVRGIVNEGLATALASILAVTPQPRRHRLRDTAYSHPGDLPAHGDAPTHRYPPAHGHPAASINGNATETPTNSPVGTPEGTGGLKLNIAPIQPLAGRDIDFTLTGLQPWQADILERTPVPSNAAELNTDASSYLATLAEWLALELEFTRTGIDAKRIEANQMITGIQSRGGLVRRGIADLKVVYNLNDPPAP